MRKLTVHFLVASLTFIAGLVCTHLADRLLVRPATVSVENLVPAAPAHPEPLRTCEVHEAALQAVRIQRICGEYKGPFRGGWAEMTGGCTSPKKRRMSLEDAQFYLNQSGGMSTWLWWEEAEAAQRAHFPHGYGWLHQDCESGEERCATIYSCAECRAAEVRWKKDSLKRTGQ